MFRVSGWKVKAFPYTFKVFLQNNLKCAKCMEKLKKRNIAISAPEFA